MRGLARRKQIVQDQVRYELSFDRYDRIAGLAVTVELVVLTIDGDRLQVVMFERPQRPFKGCFVLPGRFMHEDQALDFTAITVRSDLGLYRLSSFEVGQFSNPGRDPRGRYIAIGYCTIAEIGLVEEFVVGKRGAALLDIHFANDGIDLSFGGLSIEPGFDHLDMIASAIVSIRRSLDFSLAAFQFLPHFFTLAQLQSVHEVILNRPLSKPLFRKRMLGRIFEDGSRLLPTGRLLSGAGRPAELYERRAKEK